MQVMKFLPHGIIDMDIPDGLPQAPKFVAKCVDKINVLFRSKRTARNISKVTEPAAEQKD